MPNISTPDTEGKKAGTDGLLDEATRLADDWRALHEGDVLHALIERVRVAEAARDQYRADTVRAERAEDDARGKLDAVRALHRPERPTGNLVTDETPSYCGGCYEAGAEDSAPPWEDCPTLAAIDAAGSTRPQEATGG